MNQIVKNFNNLVKNIIFKVRNKTNNKFIISTFNKYLITFIGIIFFYLFYLSIPLLYDKSWVQNNIESRFINEFKINLSTSADISYRILPAPHFLIKNSKISLDKDKNLKSIADIKTLKVFISQKRFFDKNKMNLTKVIINNANFSLLRSDIKILNNYSNNKFSQKKITINKSNIFFKDNSGEIITIIKINKAILFFDTKKLLNLFNLKGNAFAMPFTFELKNENNSIKNKEINFEAESLKLRILNESFKKINSPFIGINNISLLNSRINTKYKVKEKLITFVSSYSRINRSEIEYSGELSINPFDLILNINLHDPKISQLFILNPTLMELIKSGLLFNDNISLNTSIVANSDKKNELFQNVKINFNIINGRINLDNSKFVNNEIGLFVLNNSNLFIENNNLILNTDVAINIENSDRLFSFLNTKKKSRKEIKNILINLDYNFLSNQFKFNKIKLDGNEASDQFLNIIDAFTDNEFNNLIKSRRLLNELFNIYEG